MRIGPADIPTNIFLAPLSGCSDLSFRLIAREHGAGFCFFEMADSVSMIRKTPGTLRIFKTHPRDTPIAAQLLGEDPGGMLAAAKTLLELAPYIAFLDINSACPAKKVVKKGAGASLLKEPEKLYRIIDALVPAIPLPITVKMRIGYDARDSEMTVDIAKKCEGHGVCAVFIHGRAKADGYSGEVDYASIKAVKDALKIPVFGIGNILNAPLAKRMFDETGCDGIAVARGAVGNPWIFREIECYLKHGKAGPAVERSAKKETLKKHLAYVEEYKDLLPGGKVGFMRKISLWYTKGFPEAKRLREKLVRGASYSELVGLIDNI